MCVPVSGVGEVDCRPPGGNGSGGKPWLSPSKSMLEEITDVYKVLVQGGEIFLAVAAAAAVVVF